MRKVQFSIFNLKSSFFVFGLIMVAQKCNCKNKFKAMQGLTNEVFKDDQIDYSFRENDNVKYNKSGNKSKYFDNDEKKKINIDRSNRQDGDDEYNYVEDKNREDNDNYQMKDTEGSEIRVSEYKHDSPKKFQSSSLLQVVANPKIFGGFSYTNDICKKNKSGLYENLSVRDHDEKNNIQSRGIHNDANDFFVRDENSHLNRVSKIARKSHHDSNSELMAINDQQSRIKENFLIPHENSMTFNQADSVDLNYQAGRTKKLSKIWHVDELEDKFHNLNGGSAQIDNRVFHHLPKSKLNRERYFSGDNFHRNFSKIKMKKPFEHKHCFNIDRMKNYYPNNDNYVISNRNLSPSLIHASSLKEKIGNKAAKSTSDSELNNGNKFPVVMNTQNKNLLAYKNLNDYSRKLQNDFVTGEEVGIDNSNNMYSMQENNEIPFFDKNFFRSVEDNLTNSEGNHSENPSFGCKRFENDSRSVKEFKSNNFVDEVNHLDLNIHHANHYRNKKHLLTDFHAGRNEILVKEPVKNFSEYKVMSRNKAGGEDSTIRNRFELKDNQAVDSNKRSILNKQNIVFRPFLRNDLSADDSEYSEVMANLSNGNIRSSNIIYDYDLNEKGENTAENNFDTNINRNGFKGKEISNLSTEVESDLQKPREDVKLFNHMSTKKAAHIPFANDDKKWGNQLVFSNVKKYKAKQKKIDSTSDDDSNFLMMTSPKSTLSKKLSENEGSNRLSGKGVGRQCHPAAGPPKFRWCSEDSDPTKDQEYEDALKGKVALRIVEVILAKVQKSSKMLSDFGFCKTKKKPSANDEDSECSAQSSILNSEDLKQIMLSLDNMSYRGCNQLPPKLKAFLEWLVKVKHVRSVHSKGVGSMKYSHSNCSLGDSAFLFHKYSTESSSAFVNPKETRDSIHENIPYISSVDYDYSYSSNDKNSADGINDARSNFVSLDGNMVKGDSILMPEYKNPELFQKYKQRVNDYNVNYLRGGINSNLKYSQDFVNDYDTNRVVRDESKKELKDDESLDYPLGKNLQYQKIFGTEVNGSNHSNVTNTKLFNSRRSYEKDVMQDIFEEYRPNYKKPIIIANFKSNPTKIIGNSIEEQNKESNEKSNAQELFHKNYPHLNLKRSDRNKFYDAFEKYNKNGKDAENNKQDLERSEKQSGFYNPVIFHV